MHDYDREPESNSRCKQMCALTFIAAVVGVGIGLWIPGCPSATPVQGIVTGKGVSTGPSGRHFYVGGVQTQIPNESYHLHLVTADKKKYRLQVGHYEWVRIEKDTLIVIPDQAWLEPIP